MTVFPSRALFKAIADCHRLGDDVSPDGDAGKWARIAPLPALEELDGLREFAEVRVGWNRAGLWVYEEVPKASGAVTVNRRNPQSGDGLQVWIDTRASQTSHRATRFCHHFIVLPRGAGTGRQEPTAWQANIRRARERAGLCDPAEIRVTARVGRDAYSIEALFPAHILQGFEAEAGTRLGFNYFAHDVHGGRQLWSAPRELPYEWDPSLWGVLELVE